MQDRLHQVTFTEITVAVSPRLSATHAVLESRNLEWVRHMLVRLSMLDV